MSEVKVIRDFPNFQWIDISNPDRKNLHSIADEYHFDYYQIQDSVQQGHLPKIEVNSNYTFLIIRAYTANNNNRISTINELSNKLAFFYDNTKIVTIHTSSLPFLNFEKCNSKSPEQLMLFILDLILDTFDSPSEKLSDDVDQLEKDIFITKKKKLSLEDLYFQKSQSRISKKLLTFTQNVVEQIEVKKENNPALQNIKDHIQDLILTYEEVTDDSINLLNTYFSINAQNSNDVMKLLTIFSAFFLPLTFIVGVYGMNFENMPELRWYYGYYFTWVVMILISIGIYLWFKRSKIL